MLPESLQEKLDEYNSKYDALSGLLGDNSLLEAEANKELRIEETKEMIAKSLPLAVKTMIDLAANAESETVRFRSAAFLIESVVGKDPALKAENPAAELIARLQKPVAVKAAAQETIEDDDGGEDEE